MPSTENSDPEVTEVLSRLFSFHCGFLLGDCIDAAPFLPGSILSLVFSPSQVGAVLRIKPVAL